MMPMGGPQQGGPGNSGALQMILSLLGNKTQGASPLQAPSGSEAAFNNFRNIMPRQGQVPNPPGLEGGLPPQAQGSPPVGAPNPPGVPAQAQGAPVGGPGSDGMSPNLEAVRRRLGQISPMHGNPDWTGVSRSISSRQGQGLKNALQNLQKRGAQ